MPPKKQDTKRGFGNPEQLPSGRWRGSYTGPDGVRHRCPDGTFADEDSVIAWLTSERKLIDLGVWTAPRDRAAISETQAAAKAARAITFGSYAEKVIRERDLTPRGRDSYSSALKNHLRDTFGDVPLTEIDAAMVRTWFSGVTGTGRFKDTDTVPTARARAYEVLRTVLNSAVEDRLITENPCRIKAATKVTPAHDARALTPTELAALADAMPERWRMSVLVGGWCGLRRGETFELRRGDVNADCSVLTVARSMSEPRKRGAGVIVKRPKTGEPRRIIVPSHLRAGVKDHLDTFVGKGRDALLFTREDSTEHVREWDHYWCKEWKAATVAAGLPGFQTRELRHTGGTIASQAGGTIAEVMDRLGHKTPNAAMKYQRIASGRAEALADAMSKLVGG